MNLFDALTGQAAAALPGLAANVPPGLMSEVTQLLGQGNAGGLGALVSQFQQNGLGDAVASWIGTGSNHAVTGEQIQAVLGNPQVAAIAGKLGLSPADTAHALAQVLPQAVNHLTPDGKLPSNELLQQGLSLLKSLG